MPPRTWELRIRDILGAISSVQEYTAEMKYDAFVADRKTVDAVIRNLIVIGEAASYVKENNFSMTPAIPSTARLTASFDTILKSPWSILSF